MDRAADNALRMLDKLLAERPDRIGHDFSEATRWLAAYRDELATIWRRSGGEPDRRRLTQINSVLSVVIGGHYPLAGIPWPHIEKARSVLANVVYATTTDGD